LHNVCPLQTISPSYRGRGGRRTLGNVSRKTRSSERRFRFFRLTQRELISPVRFFTASSSRLESDLAITRRKRADIGGYSIATRGSRANASSRLISGLPHEEQARRGEGRRRGTEFSLFPRRQHIKRRNSVALSDEGRVITARPGLSRSFDVLQRSARISGEVLRIFQSTEGSLSAKLHITISRFDVRTLRCVLARSLACVRVNGVGRARARPRVTGYTLAVSPFGIRQGYRGCSGVLVVIGVGRADHLNTRHRNHDRAPSLFLAHFLAGVLPPPPAPPAGLTLTCPSYGHRASSPSLPDRTRAWLSGEYLQITTSERPPIRFHRRLTRPPG